MPDHAHLLSSGAHLLGALVLCPLLWSCANPPTAPKPPEQPGPAEPAADPRSPIEEVAAFIDQVKNRGATPVHDDPWGETWSSVRYLEQGWNPANTLWYYFADQGSRLVPYDMLLNLEEPGSEAPLASPETFARYRFLLQAPSPNNPDGLPVGLTRSGDGVGLTCAACHTGQIIYRDVALRIDGGASLFDMVGFIGAIRDAVCATLTEEAKLARYAERVHEGDVAAARLSLERHALFLRTYAANFTEVEGGFGRVDAIGGIFNQTVRYTGGTTHSAQANAPTSYPVLWDAPRHDYVQWTGFSSNADIGSLARNVGEVVGVFGDIRVTAVHDESELKKGYESSIDARNLVSMEEQLWDLSSPEWPEDLLPQIDRELSTRGEALYAKYCQSCHFPIDRDDPDRMVRAQIYGLDIVGTDPRSATNLVEAHAPSGVLEGSLEPDQSGVLQPNEPFISLLGSVAAGALARNMPSILRTQLYARRHGLVEQERQGNFPPDSEESPYASFLAYKARPLNGIWASAPYLHNGSVPTLYDLLLPPEQRPERFGVGLWAYDPVKVGYVHAEEGAPFTFDTTIEGNHNGGHVYGTKLSEKERTALLEYLKTL